MPEPDTIPSAWAPFRVRVFRLLWIAQFTSNVGTWMQTVGAQWLMGTLTADPLKVALIQTATSLPAFLLAFPAGALGDVFDRRRVLLASQSFMLASAALLALLTAGDDTTPWILLGLTFAIGLGQAVTAPSWQAIQPQLVGRELIPHAAALGSTSMNVARAIGPALGGALVAAAGPGWVFALNAVSFLAVLGVLAWWRRPPVVRALGREGMTSALRAGARYARSSPRMRTVLLRAAAFVVFASAIWALLPVVARGRLGLGSGGYGLLLGAVGVGAIVGAWRLPTLRARLGNDRLVLTATIAFAAVCAVLAWVDVVPIVAAALVVAGFAWIAVLSSLNATAQRILPDWVRSRGLSLYLLVFQGGQALGAFGWGLVARHWDTRVAFAAVAGGLLLGAVATRRWRLLPTRELDLRPARHWPEPELAVEPHPRAGPVLVEIEYRIPVANADAFRAAMEPVGRARRRSGATLWGLFQDGADPERFVETYVVPTWDEHLRQHRERVTEFDRAREQAARSLTVDGSEPRVRHLLFAYAPGARGVESGS